MGMTREGEMSDLQFMQRPDLWPLDQALPMKRRKGTGWETAILVFLEKEGLYFFVPDATIFEVIHQGDPRLVKNPDRQGIVDDGWLVD